MLSSGHGVVIEIVNLEHLRLLAQDHLSPNSSIDAVGDFLILHILREFAVGSC